MPCQCLTCSLKYCVLWDIFLFFFFVCAEVLTVWQAHKLKYLVFNVNIQNGQSSCKSVCCCYLALLSCCYQASSFCCRMSLAIYFCVVQSKASGWKIIILNKFWSFFTCKFVLALVKINMTRLSSCPGGEMYWNGILYWKQLYLAVSWTWAHQSLFMNRCIWTWSETFLGMLRWSGWSFFWTTCLITTRCTVALRFSQFPALTTKALCSFIYEQAFTKLQGERIHRGLKCLLYITNKIVY